MVFNAATFGFTTELESISDAGLWKSETLLGSPQASHIDVAQQQMLNLCANNYLGLADHPDVVAAAHQSLDRWGYGMASVRFICGTQELHRTLERRISNFLDTDDTILYGSCFDANTGLFETILGDGDVVISDALNHASIIDGVRLCKARRLRYANRDLAELEQRLIESVGARRTLIVTDGVFSMDGHITDIGAICELAERYGVMVMIDDSHAVGFVGLNGAGTPDLYGVQDQVDIVTGTLGKALGGASGGYTSGRREIIALLRQRSRPYLFSNAVPPTVVGASLAALDLVQLNSDLRDQLWSNTARFRAAMTEHGFDIVVGEHPIVPVMFGDARRAAEFAAGLASESVLAVAFSYPVVPQGQARIRTQMSAAHSEDDVERAITAFVTVRDRLHTS